MGCIHMTIQTAVLIETLVDLGAGEMVVLQYIFQSCCCSNSEAGISVFAWKGETEKEYGGVLSRQSIKMASLGLI